MHAQFLLLSHSEGGEGKHVIFCSEDLESELVINSLSPLQSLCKLRLESTRPHIRENMIGFFVFSAPEVFTPTALLKFSGHKEANNPLMG